MTDTISVEPDAGIEAFVYEILAERFDVPVADLSPTADLVTLGIDSLGAVEVGLELRSRYGVNFAAGDIPVDCTVAAIVELTSAKVAELRAATS